MLYYKNLSLENIPNEEWRDVEGYAGKYQVSNLGRVVSVPRLMNNKRGSFFSSGKVLKQHIDKDGYLRVCLFKDGRMKNFCVHRLVGIAFIPNGNRLPQINHLDEIKTHNYVDNLEWCTNKQNSNYGTRTKRISTKLLNNRRSFPVNQYDLEGNFIRRYPSLREVERINGFSHKHIAECCRGIMSKSYGYIWKYE